MSARLANARRIVVKIGSSTLVEPQGRVREDWLRSVADDCARAQARGQEVVVVSSGAIALGRRRLGFDAGPLALDAAQAAAAVGQIALAQAWEQAFSGVGLTAAQVLLTLDDTESRRRYLNARATLGRLLACGAVPVINENDTVATAEIRYGDNDRLAARVAAMIGADVLVLLSDVDGLYTDDPAKPGAAHIPEVAEITPAVEAMAGGAGSAMGSGGMATKVMAARIATAAGCAMAIARGATLHPLRAIEDGARATWFTARATPVTARKQWILGAMKPAGSLTVDAGAEAALRSGKSLLPAGVRAVAGAFDRGDTVSVFAASGAEIARGLAAYSAADARAILGRRSAEIEALLGYRGRDEMIHRDDLVVL